MGKYPLNYDPDSYLDDDDYGDNKRLAKNRREGLEGSQKSKSGKKSRDKINKKLTHRVVEEVDEFEDM